MKLSTLNSLLEFVVTDHKSGISFFNGLMKDSDPAENASYPRLVVEPFQAAITPQQGGAHATDQWNIILQYQEALSQEASFTEKRQTHERADEIMRDVIYRLMDIGMTNPTITGVNDVNGEALDYSFVGQINRLPEQDVDSNNLTVRTVIMTIQDSNKFDFCCTEDAFNTTL